MLAETNWIPPSEDSQELLWNQFLFISLCFTYCIDLLSLSKKRPSLEASPISENLFFAISVENARIFTENARKCMHFHENVHIFLKMQENACIFLTMQENACFFLKMQENACIFLKMNENMCIFMKMQENVCIFSENALK